ncbi:hypothetical protein AB3S75_037696 [Citrus x aurantiifolia]
MRKSTREMIEEQEAVRGRLFTIQDVMQSTVRAWLQSNILQPPTFMRRYPTKANMDTLRVPAWHFDFTINFCKRYDC